MGGRRSSAVKRWSRDAEERGAGPLNAIIRAALRHRLLVVAACLLALGFGGAAARGLPIDVFPSLDRPRVVLTVECPGLAPEEVEALVAAPLEAALLGAAGVEEVRSQSTPGYASVNVDFGWDVDIRAARQTVNERLPGAVESLPPGVRPQLVPIASVMGQIVVMGATSRPGPGGGMLAPVEGRPDLAAERRGADGLAVWKVVDRERPETWTAAAASEVAWEAAAEDGSRTVRFRVDKKPAGAEFPGPARAARALRTLADWTLRPRLLRVPGVAQVTVVGGGRKQYHVLVDPGALDEHRVTLEEVAAALKANNANASGGFAEVDQTERPIRVLGRLGLDPRGVPAELADVPVKANAKRAALLGNVARIVEGNQPPRGDGTVNGQPGAILTVTKQPGADTRATTDRLEAAVRELAPALPPGVAVETNLYQMRGFIDRGVGNVAEALGYGALLVAAILLVFLANWRTTAISLATIPLALALTALVFRLVGWLSGVELSINVMTLGGIAVALGELVDDAIVDVENIHRRLRENAALPAPRAALRVVYDASREIRSAIVFGTALVALVFMPLFALEGMVGRIFAPLAFAYLVAVLSSLLVSLTATPVLSYLLLRRAMATGRHGDSLVVRLLKRGAAVLVRASLARPGVLLLAAWALVGIAAWKATQLGGELLPPFDEGSVQINVTLPSGTSIQASQRFGELLDQTLAARRASPANPHGEVLTFVRRTGRAELDPHADPPNVNECIVAINPDCGKTRADAIAGLLAAAAEALPGADVEVEQPIAHLVNEMVSGVTAQIAVKIVGDDLSVLQRLAEQVKAAAAGVKGLAPPTIEPIRQVEELHIKLRPEQLAFHGVDRDQVAKFVRSALLGETVGQAIEGQRRFDIVMRLEEPYRRDPTQFARLRVELPGGGQAPLGELADIAPGSGANQIKREAARRRLVVRCNAAGRDLRSVATDLQAAVKAAAPLPEGYFIEYGGQFESERRATLRIFSLAAASVVGMFFVVYLLFPSWRVSLQILHAIPVAFVGGVWALALTQQTLSVAGLVGFISLGGIATRNGILLVTHYLHLMRHEGESFSPAMILRGSLERLAPVLMTALAAGISLAPLVLAGNQPGREILYPVATVILGGLATSTFCEFLLHPGLFWRFSGADAPRLAAAGSSPDEQLGSER